MQLGDMLDATPLLRLYARRRQAMLARQDAASAQSATLLALLRRAAGTAFGRDHGFAKISSVEEFQHRVPLRRYEEFWRDYWQASFPRLVDVSWPGTISFFAVTSGTTGDVTKYIPVSAAMNRSNRKATLDTLTYHVVNRPQSRIMGGLGFMLGGSTDLSMRAPGIYSGDLSGIAAKTIPWWARGRAFPPLDLALIADWERKIAMLAERALKLDIRSIGGTPSWLLILFDTLAAIRGEKRLPLNEFWPNLELVIHGGVNFAPYQARFGQLLRGSHAETREVYAASEGFIASADRGPGEGMRLNLDHGLFFEFVPVAELDAAKPTRHWFGNAEEDVNYALVLSSCAGLWSYVIGDTVRFVARDPPRILITGRTAYSLSAFGEHLIGEEIDSAVAAAAALLGIPVADYSVGAVFPAEPGELGGHCYVVEFAGSSPGGAAIAIFAAELDRVLCARNEDYAAHRAGGFGMNAPAIELMPAGGFAGWMKRRGKLGGQNKVPRIVNDAKLFQDLRDFATGRRGR